MIVNRIFFCITEGKSLLQVWKTKYTGTVPMPLLSTLSVRTEWKRNLTYYPCRKQEGHKIELMLGKHRKRKINPPVVPIHPNEEKKKNLNNFITYKDLKIRWRNTSQNYRKKVTIARKWKNLHCLLPMNKPSCIFILHKNLPFTRIKQDRNNVCSNTQGNETLNEGGTLHENENVEKEENYKGNEEIGTRSNTGIVKEKVKKIRRGRKRTKHNWNKTEPEADNELEEIEEIEEMKERKTGQYYERPPKELKHMLKDKKEMFCVFKSNFINEHKVTIGDIVQTEKLHRRKAGDVVYFGTVLFLGSKDFSIIGKPTIPYCKVKAVIEQITLSEEILSFRYKKVRRSSTFLRTKHWITILKIEDIIIDFHCQNTVKDERIKPLQILDLWANRWLYQKELNFIKFNETTKRPMAEQIYDMIEHQPNTLHRRGLTECYRFYPDPHAAQTY